MLPKWHKYLAISWLAMSILLVALLVWLFSHSQVNSSIMALLPKNQLVGIPDDLTASFNQRLDKQLVWLISPADKEDIAPVKSLLKELQALPEIATTFTPIDEQQQQAWGKFFYKYRSALMDGQTRQRLLAGADQQTQWILAQLYSPFAGVGAKELAHDPLLLIRSAQLAQQAGTNNFKFKDGWLTVESSSGRTWYFIYGELASSSYDMQTAHQTVAKLQQINQQIQQNWPNTQILQRGMLYYSDYASQQAEKDIVTIGVISIIGILLIVIIFFRAVKPIAIILVAVIVGILWGTSAVLLFFGQIHIITLVMSSTVICLTIDYALFYLATRMLEGERESAFNILLKLLPTLSLAVMASCIAYAILLLAPFPGLRQLAVFAVFGLLASFVTVISWFPYLVKRFPNREINSFFANNWLLLWDKSKTLRYGLPLVCLVVSGLGISQLKVNDDISKLQELPSYLQVQDRQISHLTGQQGDQKWLVVYGKSSEEALQHLQDLQPYLAKLQAVKQIASYRLLPLSSLTQQKQNIALLQKLTPQVVEKLQAEGISQLSTEVAADLLTPKEWLTSVASEGWRLLWFNNDKGQTAILVPVVGVADALPLQELANKLPYLHWMDKHSEYNELFATYRYYLGWLIFIAAIAISLLFIAKFGINKGIRCIIPTWLSLALGLSVLGLMGVELNLFSLLSLALVLGVGIDYTLFFSNTKTVATTSLIAIFIAAIITLLTFGLLALSHTQAIADFGIVLTIGILTAFLLSPLAIVKEASN